MTRVTGRPYEVFRWKASYGTHYRLISEPKGARDGDSFTIEKLERDALGQERWSFVESHYKAATATMFHELCEALVQAAQQIPRDNEVKGCT